MDENTARKPRFFKIVVMVSVIVTALVSFGWWFFRRHLVVTDNAYVMADSATISSRIPGKIKEIYVENDDYVKKGALLIRLDEGDYRLRVEQASSLVNSLQAEYELRKTELMYVDKRTRAALDEVEAALSIAKERKKQAMDKLSELMERRKIAVADFGHARRDFERFKALFAQKAIAERDFDRVRTAYKKARAQLEAVDAAISSARKEISVADEEIKKVEAKLLSARAERLKVDVEKHRLKALAAKIEQAKRSLDIARLNLSYCEIKAPIAGYIAQKHIQVGDWVQPGQPLLAVVPLDKVYVEANFKETQLTNLRIGQKAVIEADIYPGYKYYGRVIGIRAGTGAAFSLLPPENATGNWIKVVQRVPVKIKLDRPPPPDHPLRVGLSLEVTVDTSERTGPFLKDYRNHRD